MKKCIFFIFIIWFFCESVYPETFQIPFINLPKVSVDGKSQFFKVMDRKYNTLSDGNVYLDYVLFVSKNNITDLIVQGFVKDGFVFYLNDNDFGRKLSDSEKGLIKFSVVNNTNGDFIITLKNVSIKIFRLDIDVVVLYKNVNLITILELTNVDVFPTKFQNENSYFDRKDVAIGKSVIIKR